MIKLCYDVKCEIVAWLTPLAACEMRLVSREWRDIVTQNGFRTLAHATDSCESVRALECLLRLTPPPCAWICPQTMSPFRVQSLISVASSNSLCRILLSLLQFTDPSTCNYGEAMVCACRLGRAEIVEMILAKTQVRSKYCKQSRLTAAYQGHTGLVALLLHHPRAHVTAMSTTECFVQAVRGGCIELVRRLLEHTAPGARDEGLALSAEYGHLNIAKYLLTDGQADPTHNDSRALENAVRQNRAEIVVLLLADPRVDPNARNGVALELACERHLFDLVELLLLDSRTDPSVAFNIAIASACFQGRSDLVALLLRDSRVDPTASNSYPIRTACVHGDTEIVRMLLDDPRVDPSLLNNNALVSASSAGYSAIVKLLLAHPRVDPAAQNNASLRYAHRNKHAEVVELLLSDARVDPPGRETYRLRPLL